MTYERTLVWRVSIEPVLPLGVGILGADNPEGKGSSAEEALVALRSEVERRLAAAALDARTAARE